MKQSFILELSRLIPKLHLSFASRGSGLLTEGRVSVPQMILLEIVKEKNTITVTEISKKMGISKSAVTGLTDRLIRSSLIARKRGTKDRRIVIISLTEKGETAVFRLIRERENMLRHAFAGLTDKERMLYLNLIRKIYGTVSNNER